MLYNAVVKSPLGNILLQADLGGLASLYFTDQHDCPLLSGLESKNDSPSAGILNNRPLRGYKLRPCGQSQDLLADADLFDDFINPSADFLINLQKYNFSKIESLTSDTPAGIKKILQKTADQLNEYWHKQRTEFTIPLQTQGSEFQKKIWQALLDIPLGVTMSYGDLGKQAGFGAGYGRAMGTAVGSNPISIIIPCHRVLAANGTLNGYGGGLNRKAYLLQLEGFRLV